MVPRCNTSGSTMVVFIYTKNNLKIETHVVYHVGTNSSVHQGP